MNDASMNDGPSNGWYTPGCPYPLPNEWWPLHYEWHTPACPYPLTSMMFPMNEGHFNMSSTPLHALTPLLINDAPMNDGPSNMSGTSLHAFPVCVCVCVCMCVYVCVCVTCGQHVWTTNRSSVTVTNKYQSMLCNSKSYSINMVNRNTSLLEIGMCGIIHERKG